MRELNMQEVEQVSGGFSFNEVATGALAFGGATLAVALAPEEAVGALAMGAYWGISTVAGAVSTHGLLN